MSKVDEIKAFIQKNVTVVSELAQIAECNHVYSSSSAQEFIELYQELHRSAKRIGVISVKKPFFEEAEFRVQLRFDAFCSFINLDECTETELVNEGKTSYHYSIIIGNIALVAVNRNVNEEHKKAQAI